MSAEIKLFLTMHEIAEILKDYAIEKYGDEYVWEGNVHFNVQNVNATITLKELDYD